MRRLKTFKTISIVSYLLIILIGQMIGLPFFFWLLYTLFDFGNIDQLFAIMGFIGLTISCKTFNSSRTFKVLISEIISFILLASPLIRRMTAVPIELFNYSAFIIPTTIFCLSYIVSFSYSVIQYQQIQKTLCNNTSN
jgi:hypothetical protein